MDHLSHELRRLLLDNGADLVGFADLSGIVDHGLKSGVAIALSLSSDIVRPLASGPTMEYFDAYHSFNGKLNELVELGAAFLTERGFSAFAQSQANVRQNEELRTALPHKTVATKAGLGWIGKCALLVTPRFGGAVRISSLLTDAPLDYGEPVKKSLCGACRICADACPAGAASGKNWEAGLDRADFFDAFACMKKAREIALGAIGKNITLCGKCFAVCPHTKSYIG